MYSKKGIESLPRMVECFRLSSSRIISVGIYKTMETLINSIINERSVAKKITHKDKTRTAISAFLAR